MQSLSAPETKSPGSPAGANPPRRGGFREFLSELNPLQYIPVVGTIYRAVTGDTIPEAARTVGSLVVSGLTGGPVGVAIGLGTLALEKAVGFDPEAIGQRVLASLGAGAAAAPSHPSPPAAVPEAAMPLRSAAADIARVPWSQAQLAAYGVTARSDGELQRGALKGSDVLNDLELARRKDVLVA